MKGLLRTPAVQAVLGWLLSTYLGLTLATIRWTRVGEEVAQARRDAGGGLIVCFWHGRIALSPVAWPRKLVRLGRAQEPRALISLSPDGAFIAGAMARLGFPAIRGSSTKRWDKAKAKGGAAAFREALRWVQGGGGIAITPDGPRGPAEVMAEGAVRLAKRSGAPVLLLGLAARPAVRLASWDRTVLPLPFGRGALVWAGPLHAEHAGDDAEIAAEWSRRLSQATAEAEALVA